MRDDEARGRRSTRINPLVPVDLVIDHSVQVDEYANPLARSQRRGRFQRNRER